MVDYTIYGLVAIPEDTLKSEPLKPKQVSLKLYLL